MKEIILVGNSGHALVVAGIFLRAGFSLKGYMEPSPVKNDRMKLEYLGKETDIENLRKNLSYGFFISIGDNSNRKRISDLLENSGCTIVNAIDPTAVISDTAFIHPSGVMVGSNSCINPFAQIGKGVICNSSCIIEHECIIGNFAHIGPGAIICGNVKVGDGTMVGAGAVIKEGVVIGNNVLIGAGTIVLKNLPDNCKVVGNPARIL